MRCMRRVFASIALGECARRSVGRSSCTSVSANPPMIVSGVLQLVRDVRDEVAAHRLEPAGA